MSASVAVPTGRPRLVKRATLVSLLSVVALALVGGLLTSAGDGSGGVAGTRSAPRFELADVNDPATLVTLPDRTPTVLYFFASWCVPCRREMPIVQELFETRHDVAIVGVNHQDHRSDAREFMATHGATFPAAHDPGASVALDYGLRGLPATVFIDGDGRIAATVHGEVDRDELEARIDDLVLQEREL